MNENSDQSRIERLRKNLYSPESISSRRRGSLPQREYDVKKGWEDEEIIMPKKEKKTGKIFEKILFASVIFFIVSLIIVLLTMFGGINKVSTENVDIAVVGPTSIESGGELSLQITVTNNNTTDLELSDLIVKYPSGTHSADTKEEINSIKTTLDTVPSGKSVRKEVKAILYGEESSNQEIIISLEYRMAGSNAIFFKERKYEVRISSSPINISISPIDEITSGQEIEFSVSVFSNTADSVSNLILVGEYPFGFEFKSSEPRPTYGNNVWEIKDLADKGSVIKIKGIVKGQDEEERVFKFNSGTRSTKDEKKIGAIFASLVKSVTIKKPFIGVTVAVNGSLEQESVTSAGKPVRVDIQWSNNSPEKILNGEIVVKLSGDALDKTKVDVDRGYYRSSDNTIYWNSSTSGELSDINPGEGGHFSFSFVPRTTSTSGLIVEPQVNLNVSVGGNRTGENGVPEKIVSSVSRQVKVSSQLSITPRATYFTGAFVNSGPIPPKADQETTYTITLAITNTSNSMSGVKVLTSLPSYVRWLGVVSPSTEKLSYNPVGGEVVWEAGTLKAGTGIISSAKEVSFQVALLPSISQIGSTPNLTNDVTVVGFDNFTNTKIQETKRGVTTRLSTDPGFTSGKDVVVE